MVKNKSVKIFHFSLGERLVYFNNEGLLQTCLVQRRGRSPELKNSSSSLFMCAIRFEGLGRKKVSCLGSLAHVSKHLESLFHAASLLSSVKMIFHSLLSTLNSQLLTNGPFLRQQGSNGGINSH